MDCEVMWGLERLLMIFVTAGVLIGVFALWAWRETREERQ